jgi:hypothetical protein
MSSYSRILSIKIDEKIHLITKNGDEIYLCHEVRQILLRKKKYAFHHKLVYVTIILLFLITSVLIENTIVLYGIFVIILIFWMLPKYQYYLKLNFAINSKKYSITKQQFLSLKSVVHSYNKSHQFSHA